MNTSVASAGQDEPGPLHRQRGFALLVVLWTVVLLSLMAGAFARDWRLQTRFAHAAATSAEAEAAADAGLHLAIGWLRATEAAKRPAVDGTPIELVRGTTRLTIRIEDEAGKIDLNRSGVAMLRGLLEDLAHPADEIDRLIDAIADYRDADPDPRPNGAEDRDYQALGLKHGAKDAPFQAIEELRQVVGMTDQLYARMAPALTVYNTSRRIAPAAAPSLVRKALNMAAPEPGRTRARARTASRGAYTVVVEAEMANGARFIRRAVVRLSRARARAYRILRFGRGLPIARSEEEPG